MTALWLRQEPRYDVSSQFFGESLAVAGLLTEPPWRSGDRPQRAIPRKIEKIPFRHTTTSDETESGLKRYFGKPVRS